MIHYVEEKKVDWDVVQEMLQCSSSQNKWTNFGPITQLLEQKIHTLLKLHTNLSVVMCANGTVALHALVNMHNYLNDKILHWGVSSFGFASTVEGPLMQSAILDCDNDGFLPEENFSYLDGIIVTNVFGLKKTINYQHRLVIVDSAAAFDCHHNANEIISFHHTKPWGFGEGGCVIIHKDHENLFRKIINFGLLADNSTKFATNGKLSDISSAFILQRLNNLEVLRPLYNEQYKRIVNIATYLGFKPLANVSNYDGMAPNVPLLYVSPIYKTDNSYLVMQKYYRPLSNTPTAIDLYKRIVNCPCHPAVSQYTNYQIETSFKEIIKNNYDNS